MVSDNATAAARGRCRDIDDDDVPNNNTSNPADEHIIYISRKVGKANPKRDALLFFGFLMFVFLISYQTGDVGYSMNSDNNNASNDDNDNDDNNGGNKNKNNSNRRHHSSAAINGWGNRRKQLRRALLNPLVTIMNNYLSRNGINNSDDLHNCDYYLGSSSMISSSSSYEDDDDGGHGGRNNARWNKNNAKAKKKKQQKNNILIHQDIKSGLLLLQRAVARYDHPLVAKLLPTTEHALKKYHQEYNNIIDKPSSSLLSTPMSILGSLNNKTVVSLAVNAQCMSHIRWAKSSSTSSSSPAPTPQIEKDITTTVGEDNLDDSFSSSSSSQPHQQIVSKANGFLHGDVLAIVPLLILQDATSSIEEKHDDESCSASSSCTTAIVDTCIPLQEQYSARTSLSSSTLSLCPLFGIQEVTQDPKRANVKYMWSTTNDDSIMGQKTLRSFLLISSEEEDHKERQLQLKGTLLKKYPLSMTWNLVALRDIQQNETVCIIKDHTL
ncbi:hypothetical protein FRACYDRAFT_236068 [Fragilariopsis cylindrus CCMP1102]|uniref:Uncharacterized protein n=1 Tax=Fragilariopsis cylindrus CCMP1102 TaxID=635003 RepID=A0A1E7FPD0_9STRA|nr:hypothetical protein FRACYDRAFT_236068 [Fragilariopsis cylindrus CCMP1102]|eukprot:OEU20006.1 hypothetical protein FRACYDRAFT_236068 [Fragilariopsis cylindrus CCMP1102]